MNTQNRLRGAVSIRADATSVQMITDLNKAFAEFKAAQEANAAKADAVTEEKIIRVNSSINDIQAALDAIVAKQAAMAALGNDERKLRDPEYSAAFASMFKKGEIQASVNKGADAEGGFLAPIEWDRTITDKLKLVSRMRSVARIQPISGTTFSKLFSNRETASGWVGEQTARTETASGTFGSLQFPTGEIYANPSATQQMLDDALVDVESWLAGEVNVDFAKMEGAAFINGDGVNKPHGMLGYVTGGSFATRHPFGAIQVVNSTAAATLTADGILNLIYALPTEFTNGAVFLMNRNTMLAIRKLKDGQGNYLWQPSYVAGQPSTLAGYPVIEMPDMPNLAANSLSVAFGNFDEGYLILDRAGVRVLRDPYTNKPFVMFYTTKRVGGGVLNPEAIKVQRCAV
jgi:HK97 family phage major capsid protein